MMLTKDDQGSVPILDFHHQSAGPTVTWLCSLEARLSPVQSPTCFGQFLKDLQFNWLFLSISLYI